MGNSSENRIIRPRTSLWEIDKEILANQPDTIDDDEYGKVFEKLEKYRREMLEKYKNTRD